MPRHSDEYRLASHLEERLTPDLEDEFESPVRQELGALTKSG
jgi:hypothetical protein